MSHCRQRFRRRFVHSCRSIAVPGCCGFGQGGRSIHGPGRVAAQTMSEGSSPGPDNEHSLWPNSAVSMLKHVTPSLTLIPAVSGRQGGVKEVPPQRVFQRRLDQAPVDGSLPEAHQGNAHVGKCDCPSSAHTGSNR